MHGPHKHKIDDLWDVYARVEHIDRDGKSWFVLFFELAYEAVTVGSIVDALDACIDDLQHSQILREHFLENLANAARMFLGHSEDNGLAGKRTASIFDAGVHYLFPLLSQGIAIRDEHLKISACVVNSVW